jgi:hypothetical protein
MQMVTEKLTEFQIYMNLFSSKDFFFPSCLVISVRIYFNFTHLLYCTFFFIITDISAGDRKIANLFYSVIFMMHTLDSILLKLLHAFMHPFSAFLFSNFLHVFLHSYFPVAIFYLQCYCFYTVLFRVACY